MAGWNPFQLVRRETNEFPTKPVILMHGSASAEIGRIATGSTLVIVTAGKLSQLPRSG
jgi:hypothetical protein